MDDNSPEKWWRSMPRVTRTMMTSIFVVTILVSVRLLNPLSLILNWELVRERFHFWRLLSDYIFIGNFSFGWLMHMYFFVSFSSKLEEHDIFKSSRGAYLYFLFIQIVMLDLVSLLFYWPSGKAVMAPALSFAVIYYWSRLDPYHQVGLWGYVLPAYQFPFALILLNVIMGNSVWNDLMGLFTGHSYYFLRDLAPMHLGRGFFVETPHFFDSIIDIATNLVPKTGGAAAPAGRAGGPQPPPAAFGGAGYRLGGN